jgi:hypothetical protein
LVLVCAVSSGIVRERAATAAEPEGYALLQRGIALQRDASWNASIAMLERARAGGLATAAERAECAFYLAAAYLAINSEGAARRELALVLEERPGFEVPPYTSPKLASLFGDVTRERARSPVLEARPPRPLPADQTRGSGLELSFDTKRELKPVYGVVRFRMRGQVDYAEAPLAQRAPGSFAAEVRPTKTGVLEYYADALSPLGALRAGSALAPLELPIGELDPPRGGKAGRRNWKLVWLAVPLGIVVGVGAGVGAYYGLRSRH